MENLEVFAPNAKYNVKAYTVNGRPCAGLYRNTPKGRYQKEVQQTAYRFGTEAERFDWVLKQYNKIQENDRQEIERKAKQKAEARANAEKGTVKVGTIFYASWGYDQTNVDFYEVVAIKNQTATVREISQNREHTGHDCGRCTPIPGNYYGQPMTKRVNFKYEKPSMNISSSQHATMWDGTSKYFSSGH